LLQVKGKKAECPLCRTALTPLITAQEVDAPVRIDYSMGYRDQIVANMTARRERLRLRNNQREHEERRALALAIESDKENQRS
jgi:hypothetical protein